MSRLLWLGACVLVLTTARAASAEPEIWRDAMDDTARWKIITADGVALNATAADADGHKCIRLDYDFARGSGYGIIRRELDAPLPVPANYRVRFKLRGEGPRNTLEFKLVQKVAGPDGAPGEDVWWLNQRDYPFAGPWREVVIPKRKIGFAWGPGGGKPLERIDAIEIVVTSFNGGHGTIWLDDLVIERLPEVKPYAGTPRVEVSSRADEPAAAKPSPLGIDEAGYIGWRSRPIADDPAPEATTDFGEPREFGGLVLEWERQEDGWGPRRGRGATEYVVTADVGSGEWREIARIRGGNGGRDYLVTPDALAQRLRIHCDKPESIEGVSLRSLRIMPPEFADSPNTRLEAIAKDSPRGYWPRYLLGEGTYWTVVGTDSDVNEALIGEDGAIEIAKQGPSLEPFIVSKGHFISWNESKCTQSLDSDYLPFPIVRREVSQREGDTGLRLDIQCFADDAPPMTRGQGMLFIRYLLTNTGKTAHSGTLHLAARPLQVNPTYQFLNTPGGAASIRQIRVEDTGISLDDRLIIPLDRPATFGAWRIEQGEAVEHIAAGPIEGISSPAEDPAGLASCVLSYPFELSAGASTAVHVLVPLHPESKLPALLEGPPSDAKAAALWEARLAAARREWADKLNTVQIELPADAKHWWNSARSNLAYILINRDGPGIQPGSRSYERTWIRDGALTSSALLAFGHEAEVRDFLDWFAPFQYEDGKIPCCVDRRGPDPVPENDSHGEYLYAVMNVWRYTGDTEFLRRHWPRVVKTISYIEKLRAQRMTAEFASPDAPPEKRMLYGLLPESISHEGYSAKPMHSYWDDLWTMKGLEGAAEMAAVLGESSEGPKIAALRDSFRETLAASIRLAMQNKKIAYIPGCAELGDFDATSTTIGIWPCDQLGKDGVLPPDALRATFEKYWSYFDARRSATGEAKDWVNYTPYEWRTLGTMIRLGSSDETWRERAMQVAEFFFADQHPPGWNQWAEVVWRDKRHPGFIGDMPHTWVGSDFLNSFRSMFAFENDRERSLVIGAGLPLEWLMSPEGVKVSGLRTHFGTLNLTTRRDKSTVKFEIGPGLRPDAATGGMWLSLPNGGLVKAIRVDGQPAEIKNGLLRLPRVPAGVEVEFGR